MTSSWVADALVIFGAVWVAAALAATLCIAYDLVRARR